MVGRSNDDMLQVASLVTIYMPVVVHRNDRKKYLDVHVFVVSNHCYYQKKPIRYFLNPGLEKPCHRKGINSPFEGKKKAMCWKKIAKIITSSILIRSNHKN